jgi:hypothetical protein
MRYKATFESKRRAAMPHDPIDTILSRATSDIRKLLEEAFEAGRNEMRGELSALLMGGDTAHTTTVAPSQGEGRAPAGTVKPTIKALIMNTPSGIRASQIIEKTGFKENSVRGTLSTLKDEGFLGSAVRDHGNGRGGFVFIAE